MPPGTAHRPCIVRCVATGMIADCPGSDTCETPGLAYVGTVAGGRGMASPLQATQRGANCVGGRGMASPANE